MIAAVNAILSENTEAGALTRDLIAAGVQDIRGREAGIPVWILSSTTQS